MGKKTAAAWVETSWSGQEVAIRQSTGCKFSTAKLVPAFKKYIKNFHFKFS